MTNTDSSRKIHHGRNIKRFREMFGLKQEALALELGDDWSQKKVSRMEENESVEDEDLVFSRLYPGIFVMHCLIISEL